MRILLLTGMLCGAATAQSLAEFGDVVRLVARRRAINLDRPDLAFQVMSGASTGTFVFLSPIATSRAMDDGRNPVPVYAEGVWPRRGRKGEADDGGYVDQPGATRNNRCDCHDGHGKE